MFVSAAPGPTSAGTPANPAAPTSAATKLDVPGLVTRLKDRPFVFTDNAGKVLEIRRRGETPPAPLTEANISEALTGVSLSAGDAATLWDFFADEDNARLATLPVVSALIRATDTPKAREAMWTELAALEKENKTSKRERSLITVFERNRTALRPHFVDVAETESSGDEMVDLMLASKVFGATLNESIARLSMDHPAALARRMERERGRGKPVTWEETAYDGLLAWAARHVAANAPKAPASLAALDAAGETYATIFNCLHDFDPKYRTRMLTGLGPAEVFNAVVGGEMELYRMGTSSYRDHLHAVIMRGIKAAGSFEAFLTEAAPRRYGGSIDAIANRRGMVFLRVVTSFGLLDPVLDTVRDRDTFLKSALESLGDTVTFERNSSVLMDLLTAPNPSKSALAFRQALLGKLYDRYRTETEPRLRNVYGSMLSVYQTVTEDRRDPAIDTAFPLDDRMIRIPFDRLFTTATRGGLVHRMFMRLDQDTDATATHASFRTLMRSHGAAMREDRNFEVYRLRSNGRAIEIYVNKPTAVGTRRGISDLSAALRGQRVETIVGRGHTAIVEPLQSNTREILGDRIGDVAVVLLGTCGGDASVDALIRTFGHRAFVSTRSTGRQAINNAFMEVYIASLFSLPPNARLSLDEVLYRTTARFMRKGGDEDLRDDAAFYRISKTAVLTARLFETHVKPVMTGIAIAADQIRQ